VCDILKLLSASDTPSDIMIQIQVACCIYYFTVLKWPRNNYFHKLIETFCIWLQLCMICHRRVIVCSLRLDNITADSLLHDGGGNDDDYDDDDMILLHFVCIMSSIE